MTKILFAATASDTYPFLATNDHGLQANIKAIGYANIDDYAPFADIMNLAPGFYVWEGDINGSRSEIRPATQTDMHELGFPCPTDTAAPPGSFLADVAAKLDQMQPNETMTISRNTRS
jgi:hypothetical protein